MQMSMKPVAIPAIIGIKIEKLTGFDDDADTDVEGTSWV